MSCGCVDNPTGSIVNSPGIDENGNVIDNGVDGVNGANGSNGDLSLFGGKVTLCSKCLIFWVFIALFAIHVITKNR